jgi:hypothetical protein
VAVEVVGSLKVIESVLLTRERKLEMKNQRGGLISDFRAEIKV